MMRSDLGGGESNRTERPVGHGQIVGNDFPPGINIAQLGGWTVFTE